MSTPLPPRGPGLVGNLFRFVTRHDVPPVNQADLMFDALTSPLPPTHCPLCTSPAVGPVKDENGDWTWKCAEGCNP